MLFSCPLFVFSNLRGPFVWLFLFLSSFFFFRFGETGTTVDSATTRSELVEELKGLTPSIKKAIREYEEKWETQFLFEGKCYMDVVEEDENRDIKEINV